MPVSNIFSASMISNALRSSKCSSKNPVKEIKAMKIHRAGDWIWIDVEADGFLHHMVRNIVGVLREVGNGERSPEWVADVIASRDRKAGWNYSTGGGFVFCKGRLSGNVQSATFSTRMQLQVMPHQFSS